MCKNIQALYHVKALIWDLPPGSTIQIQIVYFVKAVEFLKGNNIWRYHSSAWKELKFFVMSEEGNWKTLKITYVATLFTVWCVKEFKLFIMQDHWWWISPLIRYCIHDDVMTWKLCPHYWPFVRGIHQSLVDSSNKGPVMQTFGVFFVVCLNKLLDNRGLH